MPSLAGFGPGFYETYRQRSAENQQAPMRDLQQISQVLQIKNAVRQQQEEQQLKQQLAQAGGDVEKVIQGALKAGRVDIAAKLAPLAESQRKANEKKMHSVGSGGLYDPSTNTVIPPAPRPAAPPAGSDISKLISERDALPPNDPRRAIYDAAIKVKTTRQDPIQVNQYGAPTIGIDDKGNPVFFQPSRTGQAPQIVQGVKPPPVREPAADAKAKKDAAEQEVTLESVRQRITSMQSKLQSETGVVGPLGIARRAGETAAGVVAPGIPTPALDYQNEMRLLVADVRKVVEKDPNLSNQERQNLYETLGGGTFQTPGSAYRTLNNVLGYMENKRATGPGRQAWLEQAVKAAGWSYEPDKYEYRILDGKVQRKPK